MPSQLKVSLDKPVVHLHLIFALTFNSKRINLKGREIRSVSDGFVSLSSMAPSEVHHVGPLRVPLRKGPFIPLGLLLSLGLHRTTPFSLQFQLLPTQPPPRPPSTPTGLTSDQQLSNLYYPCCLKPVFSLILFSTRECLKRMQLCPAFCHLASSSLNTPPSSPLFMRLSVVDLMLMLVHVWFQHIFFVPRLTFQLPLSLPPGVPPGGPVFRTSTVNLWHNLLPALEISQQRGLLN